MRKNGGYWEWKKDELGRMEEGWMFGRKEGGGCLEERERDVWKKWGWRSKWRNWNRSPDLFSVWMFRVDRLRSVSTGLVPGKQSQLESRRWHFRIDWLRCMSAVIGISLGLAWGIRMDFVVAAVFFFFIFWFMRWFGVRFSSCGSPNEWMRCVRVGMRGGRKSLIVSTTVSNQSFYLLAEIPTSEMRMRMRYLNMSSFLRLVRCLTKHVGVLYLPNPHHSSPHFPCATHVSFAPQEPQTRSEWVSE